MFLWIRCCIFLRLFYSLFLLLEVFMNLMCSFICVIGVCRLWEIVVSNCMCFLR